jgi:hypothetical protein
VYQLLSSIGTNAIFFRQLPLLVVSFGIANLFYKFGSFGLECLAFLATWFVLDVAVQTIARLRRQRSPAR